LLLLPLLLTAPESLELPLPLLPLALLLTAPESVML
jgi:hypothetical protein